MSLFTVNQRKEDYMRLKQKINKYIFKVLMVLVTLISTFFNLSMKPVQASELNLPYDTGYNYKAISYATGQAVDVNLWRIVVDGNKDMFCIESHILTYSGGGYVPESFVHSKKDIMSKIAHYGYMNTSKTDYDYAVTQVMIWEALGDHLTYTNIPNYQAKKAEIMAKVNKHDTLPSWNKQKHQVQVGNSITLTDANSVFSDMKLQSNNTNATLKSNGNNLTITPNENSNNGSITFNKVDSNYVGASIMYRKPNLQTVATMRLDSTVSASVNVDIIKLGNVRVQKIDEETGKPLPNATIRFSYGSVNREIVTDENGYAEIKNIPQDTQITIQEIIAPNGFVNKGESKTITIEPNTTIEIVLDNKAQRGVLHLTKTGKMATSIETTESDYGTLHNIIFKDQPLAGVTFDIEAAEDIAVGGTTHASKGDVVATVTTNENGDFINPPELYLGSYQAIEKSAPYGYIVDDTPIPFSFTYAGQDIELVNESLSVTNDFQKLKISIFKNEEVITSWSGDIPIIEEIPATDKVFGLYTGEEQELSDGSVLPADSLLHIATIQEGRYVLENIQYPEGSYYFKELDAGENHSILELQYDFQFYADDHEEVKEIIVANSDETPLVNKLHFNMFTVKKLNEKATLEEKHGYEFTYEESKGAIFTLEDANEAVIQTVSVNSESLAIFNAVPVGTFYLKEKKASFDDYVLSNEVYRIESTKEGIQVYDENDTLLGEQLVTETNTIPFLFEIKNNLVKGIAKLEKSDITTGELLPNTGVHILDENKQVVIEGKTDEKGTFTFRQLPKGRYYFQEFEAPEGYQIDKTPVKFEIKEDGEIIKVSMTNKKIVRVVSIPKTGDTTRPLLYLGIASICGGVIIGIVGYRKRNRSKDRTNK